jgi:proteasome lid subunit RPN8/RPN11
MTNADCSSEHFTMFPEEQFAVAKDIRNNDLEMLAIYHTHPETPARPSDEDIRLAFTPGVVYVIASLVDQDQPIIKGFLIEDGNVEKVILDIEL